jgi:hypothetical protein
MEYQRAFQKYNILAAFANEIMREQACEWKKKDL